MDKQRNTLLVLAVLLSFSVLTFLDAQAQISLETVVADCEKKTIVMGRDEKGDIVKVGEDLGGYCKGFFDGIFAVLVRRRVICAKDKRTDSSFLLSVVLTYRIETKSQDDDAASVVEAALRRAFNCTNEN